MLEFCAAITQILEQTDTLAAHPHAGRAGRVSGTRELVVSGTSFIAPYRVRGEVVELLAVLHGARQWPGSVMVLALPMIGQHFNHPTLGNLAMRATGNHALKLCLQGCEAGDPLLHLHQARAGDKIGLRA